ncbi:PAS domain-containing protein [Kineococcus sp. SYSU DK003]|uniref:PAS domain-containing protein n=1 Tax=Kineococcus sp. SYSU DK003 TaxID=3383124 RepID=UPI003D7CF73C
MQASFDQGSSEHGDARSARAARVLAVLKNLWGDEPPPGADPDLAWLVDALAVDDAQGREDGYLVRGDDISLTSLANWLTAPQFSDEDSGAWQFDPATGLMSLDEQAGQVLGLSQRVGVERALLDVHPDDRADVERTLRRTAETGEHFRVTLRGRSPEGDWVWRTGTGRRLVGADGGVVVVGFVTVHRPRVPVD